MNYNNLQMISALLRFTFYSVTDKGVSQYQYTGMNNIFSERTLWTQPVDS